MKNLQISIEKDLNSILKDQNIHFSVKNGIPIYNNDPESMLCSFFKYSEVGLFIIDLSVKKLIWGNSNFFRLNNIEEKHLNKSNLIDLFCRNIHNDDVHFLKNLNSSQLMNDNQTSISHTLRYRQKDKSWKHFYFLLLNPEQNLTDKCQLKIGMQYDLTSSLPQYSEDFNKADSSRYDDEDFKGFSKISEREKQILKLIVKGNTDKEIAKLLDISFYTVETHRKNIIHKLSVKNTASLSFLVGKYNFL
jgi:DNA-binding CsgD family transcriptional regulator